MNIDLRLKERPVSKDLFHSEPLRTLNQQEGLCIGSALDADDLADSAIPKQVVLARLPCIDCIIILLSLLIGVLSLEKFLSTAAEKGRAERNTAEGNRVAVALWPVHERRQEVCQVWTIRDWDAQSHAGQQDRALGQGDKRELSGSTAVGSHLGRRDQEADTAIEPRA